MKRRLYLFLIYLLISCPLVRPWEWSDFIALGGGTDGVSMPSTLTREEIKLMRVRDIKRLLGRNHGYSPDELSRMLDKKELINALSNEENKIRQDRIAEIKRNTFKQGAVFTLIAVLAVFCWPLFLTAFQIGSVNFVVYTDRKRYKASRCMEFRSTAAFVGFSLMFVIDALQGWLTATVLLSWVMRRSKYFFPTPNLPVKPGQFMGKEVAGSAVGNYGINIGPMLVTWAMRFLHRRLEAWTGRALVAAQRAQRQTAREKETPEERAARRAARKEEKRAAREAAAKSSNNSMPPSSAPPPSSQIPPPDMPTGWMEPSGDNGTASNIPASDTHTGFLQEIDDHNAEPLNGEFLQELDEPTGLDDLD